VENETLNIETEDVYETPMLAEVGDFADITQGNTYGPYEGFAGLGHYM
jgi:hypothetical protein